MREPKDGLILYHGSYCEVKEPDLTKCSKRKDFGQGFYLTSSKEQAESFLKTSIAKAVAAGKIEERQNFGYISSFEIKISKEKLDFTIDLLITMAVEEIAEETGKDSKDVLTDFLCSKTGKALYNKDTRLWCNGPSYIAELYMEELSNK